MSHSTQIKTRITDAEVLVQALLRVERPKGLRCFTRDQIEVHETAAVMMKTYQGHDLGLANIIIRQKDLGLSNDIGFVRDEDGFYTGVIDAYQGYDQVWLQRLFTYYGVEKAKKEYKARGIDVTEDRTDDGRIRLRARFSESNQLRQRLRS